MNTPEPKYEKKESVSTVIDSPIASKSVPPPPEPVQEKAMPQQSTSTAPSSTSSLWQQAVSEKKPSMVSPFPKVPQKNILCYLPEIFPFRITVLPPQTTLL